MEQFFYSSNSVFQVTYGYGLSITIVMLILIVVFTPSKTSSIGNFIETYFSIAVFFLFFAAPIYSTIALLYTDYKFLHFIGLQGLNFAIFYVVGENAGDGAMALILHFVVLALAILASAVIVLISASHYLIQLTAP